MARTAMDVEQEMMGMFKLVNELSEQLSQNRALTTALQNQAKDVKGQAMHSGTGFPLRRFNIDISDEQFTSELESFASHLVLENQMLQHENKQINVLLKEYEGVLEGVMAKFRGVSFASQQHELTLHQYYTSLLHELETSHSTSTLLDSTTLSTLLTRLSMLVRSALKSVNGEVLEDGTGGLPMDLKDILGGQGEGSPSNTLFLTANQLPLPKGAGVQGLQMNGTFGGASAGPSSGVKGKRTSQWLGDLASSGGYPGTEGRGDWALEREEEIARLEEENRVLREMLGISVEVEMAPMSIGGELPGLAASGSGSSVGEGSVGSSMSDGAGGGGSLGVVRRGSKGLLAGMGPGVGVGVGVGEGYMAMAPKMERETPVVIIGRSTPPPSKISLPITDDYLETITLSPPPTAPVALPAEDSIDNGITPLAPEELEKWLREEGEAVDPQTPIEEPPAPNHHLTETLTSPPLPMMAPTPVAISTPAATSAPTSPRANMSRSPVSTRSPPPRVISSPTLTKSSFSPPALHAPPVAGGPGGLSTSPGTPLTGLFLKAGGKTKTEPTTGMTLTDVSLTETEKGKGEGHAEGEPTDESFPEV